MSRWRFNGGRMTREHMQFLAESIRKYNLQHVHFTTGQCLQMHGLDGDTILNLLKSVMNMVFIIVVLVVITLMWWPVF